MSEKLTLPVFTEALFFKRFGQSESATLEFKESLPKAGRLQEPIVAFANSRGGTVLLGISDAGRIVGVSWGQDLEERIQEVVRVTQPPIAIEVSHADVDGKSIAVLVVAPIDVGWAQTSDGRVIVRAGPTNRTLFGQELQRFLSSRASDPIEDQPIRDVDIDDLDDGLIQEYVDARLGKRRFDTPSELLNLGFLTNTGQIRLAAILLFGKEPQARNRRFGVDLLRYDGSIDERGPLRDRRQISGALPALADSVFRLIYDEMRRDAVVHGLLREEVPEYPSIAIREALLNALGHRDYGLPGSAIQVRLFADGIEIESPGALPGGVTVENLVDAQYSRNRRIMDAFHVLKLVEEAGTGIDKIFASMEDALLEPPRFIEMEQSFLVQFRGRSVFAAEDRLWIAGFTDLGLTGDEKLALVFAHRNASITNPDLRRLRPLDAHRSRVVLQGLVTKGLLAVVGERRGTRYLLTEAARQRRRQSRPDEQVDIVVSHATRQGSVVNRDVRGLLGVDAEKARLILVTAVAAGLLEPRGERRGRRYVPTR